MIRLFLFFVFIFNLSQRAWSQSENEMGFFPSLPPEIQVHDQIKDIYKFIQSEEAFSKQNYILSLIYAEKSLNLGLEEDLAKKALRLWSKAFAKISPEEQLNSKIQRLKNLNSPWIHQLTEEDLKKILLDENKFSSQPEEEFFLRKRNRTPLFNAYLLVIEAQSKATYDRQSLLIILEELQKKSNDPFLSLWITKRMIRLYREEDSKEKAAQAFLDLYKIWKTLPWSPTDLGYPDETSMLAAKIDDVLWVARYQALVGQYSSAQKILQNVQKWISSALKSTSSPEEINTLKAFQVEALYTEARRVAWQKKKMKTFHALLDKALKQKPISPSWEKRLLWIKAMGSWELSPKLTLKHLQTLQKSYPEMEQHSGWLFWMARSYEKLKDDSQSKKFYNLLLKKEPWGFYSTVAGPSCNLGEAPPWPTKLNYESNPFTKSPEEEKMTILSELGFKKWAGFLFNPLMKKKLSLEEILEKSNFLQKLGLYSQSLRLLEKNTFDKKWPLAFPLVFLDIFQKASSEYNLPLPLLLAIARQESFFDENAVSPALAFGLMQLILPTASRQNEKQPSLLPSIQKEDLFVPRINIELASRFLLDIQQRYKHLSQPYPAALIAAYNAGEYSVNHWTISEHRKEDFWLWIEMIPYGETLNYVKQVLFQMEIYKFLLKNEENKILSKKSNEGMEAL